MITWSSILDWLLKILSMLGDFAHWLFNRITFADAYEGFITFLSTPVHGNNPTKIQTIISTIRAFFEEKSPDLLSWAEQVNFAPIDLIGITGLTIVAVMSFIKLYSIFA